MSIKCQLNPSVLSITDSSLNSSLSHILSESLLISQIDYHFRHKTSIFGVVFKISMQLRFNIQKG